MDYKLNSDLDLFEGEIQAGRATMQRLPNEITSKRIDFPEPFSSVPAVVITSETSDPRGGIAAIRDPDTTGFTIYVYSNSDVNMAVSWIAFAYQPIES